ncbi:MAG: hypothetical protein SFV15_05390 [Polyangiaceae bacterium]|nr:hypothetical protein [Polyangiaceae bacterium]
MTRVVVLGLLLTVSACSDGGGTSTPMGSTGGTHGTTGGKGGNTTGGQVGSGGATGTGGTTGAARGAVSLHIIETQGCSLMDQYQDFPIVPGGRPVTASGTTKMLQDGTVENGQEVHLECSIQGTAAPYTFFASVQVGIANSRLIQLQGQVSIGSTNPGQFIISTPDLPETYGSALPDLCTFTATEVDASASKVGGHFLCGTVEGNTSKEKCKAGESYFVFENCSK